MKTFLTILLILIIPIQLFSQRKSKADPRDAKIDSLSKASTGLTLQVDSLSAELKRYMVVYSTIKERVIHYNFDPEKTSNLIDSMKSSRDSIANMATLGFASAGVTDSLMKAENSKLRVTIDSLKVEDQKYRSANTAVDIERAKALDNLKKLKEFLDAKIITEAEFTTLKKKYLDKL